MKPRLWAQAGRKIIAVLSQAQRYQKQVRKQVQISEEDTTIGLGYAHMIFADWRRTVVLTSSFNLSLVTFSIKQQQLLFKHG